MGRLNLPEITARSAELDKCVNCGLCQAVCPTYLEDGHEGRTARGKIILLKGMLEGRIEPSSSIADLADDCLTCYACQTVCPAGVKTELLWTAMRQDLAPLSTTTKRKHRALNWTVGSPKIMKNLVKRFGRVEGFDRNSPSSARLTRYGLPLFKGAPYLDQLNEIYPAVGNEVGRVGLLLGCSANLSAPWAVDSAITLLRQCGWTVVVPKEQGCCGAPAINNGHWRLAKRLARHNLNLFDNLDLQAITSPDATCISAMGHDYPNMFADEDAAEFSVDRMAEKSTDLSKLVGKALDEGRIRFNPFKAVITVHDSCHATHFGHGNRWRDLLKAIPGIEIREMAESTLCCGFGGSYSVMHRESSDKIAARKMKNVYETGAEIVLVGSPGCQIRLQTSPKVDNAPQVRMALELVAGMAM